MASFEYYKDHVSIVQVAEALGYQFNRKAGRNPLEYKHPDQHTIVISTKNGRQRYFTRHETENRGSVIDFVKHRLHLFNTSHTRESEGINKVLATFAGTSYTPSDKGTWLREQKKFNLSNYTIQKPAIKDLVYLSERRGLLDSTLNKFLPYILMVKSAHHRTRDIGFPYRIPGSETVVGMELVNFMFKGHARGSNRAEGVWMADLGQTGYPSNLFIAESSIDAMSFYQLFRQKYPLDKAAFISSGGYITDKQLRNIMVQYPDTRINTLFDNDLSGHLYDIRTACLKQKKALKIFHDRGVFKFFYANRKTFELCKEQVSLTSFRKESGIRTNIRVHKAQGKDFNEMVLERIGQSRQKLNR